MEERQDLISRQAARHALCKAVHKGEDIPCENQTASCLWTGTRVCDYVREIDALPTIQPEIVRCKDCKHWDAEWSVSESGAHYCPMVDGNRNSDFYCADAERRTE